MSTPIKAALRNSKDDMALKDKVWGQSYGLASVDHSVASPRATAGFAGQVTKKTGVAETPQPTPPTTTDAKWTPKEWSSIYGLHLGDVSHQSTDASEFSIDVTNNALRHMSTSVEFLDDMGNVIPGSRKKLEVILPGNFLMGIPMDTDATTLTFSLPPGASGARVLFGTLGTGHYDADICGMGMLCTVIFEMAVPTFLLAAGGWMQKEGGFIEVMKDREVLIVIGALALTLATPTMSKAISDNPKRALNTIMMRVLPMLGSSALGALTKWLVGMVAGEKAEEAIPIVGLVFFAVGAAGSLAELAETTAAICKTPSVTTMEVARTMTLKVSVTPDPLHSVWPSTGRHYRLMVQYRGGTFMHCNGQMFEFTKGVTSKNPVTHTFTNVPAGGALKVYAVIYSANWWIVGYAHSSGWVQALPGGDGSLMVNLTITELLVPLTPDTRYSHMEKLIYSAANGHQWKGGTDETPLPAPTDTVTAIDDTDTGHRLSQLVEITINDHAHTLGYCWRASGQHMPFTGTDTTVSDAQMYAFQNISSLDSPEAGLKATNRGMTSIPHILYDQFGPIEEGATGAGNNFYLDVVGLVYHLRRVDFDAKPFDLSGPAPKSWGKFTQEHLDAAVVHPAGYVAAVSWKNSNLEILRIPAAGVADADAVAATIVSGEGLREGLMKGPTALTVSPDGMLLVLETQNNRIQAFDVNGNPIQAFNSTSGKVSFMPLKSRTGKINYLDIGTETKGYIYVLSYLNKGDAQTDYNLDIYTPTGEYLCTTNGLNAAKMVVNMWRDVYALNYEVLLGPGGRTEPSISHWIPSTPPGTNPGD